MLFKVSAFHVYVHEDGATDEIENCTICDLAIENQTAEHQVSQTQTFNPPQKEIIVWQPTFVEENIVPYTFLHSRFFGRPPPSLV